ncbi:MAG: GNAT family N-acetyltransferase [Brachymonas sp.]
MAMQLDWQFIGFEALSSRQLYAILLLRSEVFVVEQECIYQDMDGTDHEAMHLVGTQDGRLMAYARCYPPGIRYPEASIGRVITRGELRGSGAGHALMREAIAKISEQRGPQPIRISAQAHLKDFYAQHGFTVQGDVYDEDGIPHLQMLRA